LESIHGSGIYLFSEKKEVGPDISEDLFQLTTIEVGNLFMKRAFIILTASVFLGFAIDCRSEWMDDLHCSNIGVRRSAIDAIQTIDDQRIPAACLPRLTDEGDSIRRQAARAIGSRFYQISNKDRGRYIQALEACAITGLRM